MLNIHIKFIWIAFMLSHSVSIIFPQYNGNELLGFRPTRVSRALYQRIFPYRIQWFSWFAIITISITEYACVASEIEQDEWRNRIVFDSKTTKRIVAKMTQSRNSLTRKKWSCHIIKVSMSMLTLLCLCSARLITRTLALLVKLHQ